MLPCLSCANVLWVKCTFLFISPAKRMHLFSAPSLSRPKLPVPPNAVVVPYYEYVSGFLNFSRSVSRDSVVPGCPSLADITISCNNFLLFRRPLLPLPFILRRVASPNVPHLLTLVFPYLLLNLLPFPDMIKDGSARRE